MYLVSLRICFMMFQVLSLSTCRFQSFLWGQVSPKPIHKKVAYSQGRGETNLATSSKNDPKIASHCDQLWFFIYGSFFGVTAKIPQTKPQKQHASPKMVDYFLVVRTVSGLKFAHLVLDLSFIPTLTAERHPKKPWPFLSVKLQRMRMANTGIDVTFWSMGYAATVACPSRDPPAFLGMGCGGCWLETP